jgi:4'-phosphopantetheinyl transferase
MSVNIVHFTNGKSFTRLALWSDNLPVSQLESMLTAENLAEYQSSMFRLAKRRMEWLKTRILLDHLAPGARLGFLPNGKPVLDGKVQVSVSHSAQLAAVIVSDELVGIDVQPNEPKLQNMKTRYCNDRELKFADGPDMDDRLAMIWASKEAVFKYFGERVEFASEMQVEPFSPEDELLTLRYEGRHGQGTFKLGHLFWLEQHVVFIRSYAIH